MLAGGVLIDLSSGSTTIAVVGICLIVLMLAYGPVRALRRATVIPATPPSLRPPRRARSPDPARCRP
jgi:hypothetical protein